MKIFLWMQSTIQYLWDGVSRLFTPTDDNYPETGIQPYSGEPNNDYLRFD